MQKKSVVTASISSITADKLKNQSQTRIDNVLQGMTSGVTVTTTSGAPDAGAQVRIRGVGSINNSEPLYIVDGLAISGGIDYLNPNDIERIEVLKDAASGAVYGARATNGVILVTTKRGEKGGAKVNYDFSYGWQNPWRKPKVLNATEYAIMMNEGAINSGNKPRYENPYEFGKGTDWVSAIFNDNAPVMKHDLTISGASDQTNYALSAGYLSREGIIGGNYDRSKYERITLRANLGITLFDRSKQRDWLNKLTLQTSTSYARILSKGISTNSEYGSPLGSAIGMSPLEPIFADEATEESYKTLYPEGFPYIIRDKHGRPYTIADGTIYNEQTNPLAALEQPGEKYHTDKFVSNFVADLDLYDGLKFRTSVGIDLAFWGSYGYAQQYFLSSKNYAYDTVTETTTYDKDGNETTVSKTNYATSAWQSMNRSLLWQVEIEATVRRDGSSRFGSDNKWGNFPSVSIGWNAKNESFLSDVKWLSAMKLRGSWGINGNDNIGDFRYAVYMNSGNNYVFGSGANGTETIATGAKPSGLANPDVKWEESRQVDVGLDLAFLNNKLTFTIDYYDKKTKGMLLDMPVPQYSGDSAPVGNLGDMKNYGIEMEIGYRYRRGHFGWHVSANATYNRNKLTYLGDDSAALYGSSHKIGQLTRGIVGLPFPYFYGWKTAGIFQNMDEVNSYVNADGKLLQPNAQPGDVRFVDIDRNGAIDDDDRTMIGKGMPDWTFGLNLGFEWKGFDFNLLLQGQAGCEIFNVTRRTDLYYINLPKTILNRWTGEGSTNKYPRFSYESANQNYRVSDLWLEDGSFLRARNLQLGYTLPQRITRKAGISRLRIYFQAENIFTLTDYSGCDPEVTGGNGFGTEIGIDRGVYPQSRTFSVGVNLSF